MPVGYKGEFGPGVHALVRVLYHAVNTSEPKIVEFFDHIGVHISSGQVSNLLIKNQDCFHAEKDAVYKAGLRSSPWQHIDETGTRVNGVNEHCHVVCNPLYTAYFTTDKKDALLMVLHHPEILLHNNPAEIEIRRRVRKRDVSFGPRTEDGKRAWDTFATLLATTKKLGVSFYRYVYDRVTESGEIPNLADLIDQRAQQMNLAASWESA